MYKDARNRRSRPKQASQLLPKCLKTTMPQALRRWLILILTLGTVPGVITTVQSTTCNNAGFCSGALGLVLFQSMHSSVDVFELFVFTNYYHPEVTLRGFTAYALLLIHGNQKQTGGGRGESWCITPSQPVRLYQGDTDRQTDGEGGRERERERLLTPSQL